MSDKQTGPYVPNHYYICPCGVEADGLNPEHLWWHEGEWVCPYCGPSRRPDDALALADHLKSLEPRWVPVRERLPEFDEDDIWIGWAMGGDGGWLVDCFHRQQFDEDHPYGYTHWLDFTPPELPGEEVGQ